MFLIDAIKSIGAINKATKFIKQQDKTVEQIKVMVEKVKEAINWLEAHKDGIQKMIDKAKNTFEKLKGLINK